MIARAERTSLTRELLGLALPMMLSNLAYTLLGVIDTLYMGRIGTVEVAAVGLANITVMTLILFFRGSLNTVTIFVARAFGANTPEGVRRWYGIFLALALLAGIPVAALGQAGLLGILRLFGPEAAVFEAAHTYGAIRLLEAPFSMLVSVNVGFMVALGNSRTPMVLAWTTVAVNALLAWLMIFPLGMGVAGAAWSTVAALAVQALLSHLAVARQYGAVYGPLRPLRPTRAELTSIGRISAPAGLTELAEVSAFNTFIGVISRLGAVELAASNIANQFASFGFMPVFALSAATGSLVSRYLGSGNPDASARVGWRAAGLGMLLMLPLALAFVFIPEPLLRLFTNQDEIIPLGMQVMRLMAIYQILDGLGIILGGALGGAGDTRFRMLVTVSGAWGIMVPAALLLTNAGYGVQGAWGGALIYIMLISLIYAVRFRSGRWRKATL
ncbi:MATE family multidrug resistance protein [Deinobacterium chartae]|uniref:Multidrug-efflux transporter n=1 Tax=Deinobacterium chartae TaxID=521158 RepID=A0A841HVZ1_9DEIO|nr:MATE family efflux transporter [Deinobacterium chartae]MBB6096834.1 MATE family multidrug resistance protein [Deinobacterium chartae]